MGLFDKKYCDFCGRKIGLFGNKKLEDGNMCKDCASKLSPWFSERRHSTKEEIAAIITHATMYVGWPKGWAVFRLAKDVWNEERENMK